MRYTRVKREREWKTESKRETALQQRARSSRPTKTACRPTLFDCRRALSFFQSLNLLLLLHTKSTNNNKHSDQEEENYCAAEWNCKSKSWIKMASQPKTETTTPTTAAAKVDRQGVCRESVCVSCVYTCVWVCLLVCVCVITAKTNRNA